MVDEDRAEGIGHNVRGKLQDAVRGPSRCTGSELAVPL